MARRQSRRQLAYEMALFCDACGKEQEGDPTLPLVCPVCQNKTAFTHRTLGPNDRRFLRSIRIRPDDDIALSKKKQ